MRSIFPIFLISLIYVILFNIIATPVALEQLSLGAYYFIPLFFIEGGPGGILLFILYFILPASIISTILGFLSVYYRKLAYLLIFILPLLVFSGMFFMFEKSLSSRPPEIAAILMSIFTPLFTIAWLSKNNQFTETSNLISKSLKTGVVVFLITSSVSITFPYLTSRSYSRFSQKQLETLKAENTFLKRPTYLPANVTITTMKEELVVDQGLWWDYTCKVPSGSSATLYIRQVPIGEYTHNLSWYENPEYQKTRQEQFTQEIVNGKKGWYSEPISQNYGWKNLWWESDGNFLEIASDYNCSHSKDDLIKIAESMR